jgi:ubiquinone/menaquinone biosynthesis C-methylase UbiE
MDDDAAHWDEAYRKQGRLWGGMARDLPALPSGSRVLELGCGSGKTFFALLGRGAEVVGIDFSAPAVSLAASLAAREDNGHVAIADARCLPFASGSFDAVTAMHVIGHVPAHDRERIRRELARVLCDRGLLWFTGFSCDDFRAGKGRMVEPCTFERETGIRTHYFTEDEVRDLFSGVFEGTVDTRQWSLRVSGTMYRRVEIVGAFRKSPGTLAPPKE